MTTTRKSGLRRLLMASAAVALLGGLAVPVFEPNSFLAQAEVPAAQSLLGPDGSYAEIVRRAKPAVVTITTRIKPAETEMSGMQGGPFPGGLPPEEFFRRFFGEGAPGLPGGPQAPQPQEARALGSGFLVDPSGIIVTNNHVIANASEIKVTLDDGREFTGELVGTDPKTDVAVVRIRADGPLPYVEWGDSDRLAVGDKVIAIGNPFGVGTTVTAGIVSARGRDLRNGPYDDFIQVDAAINHGNSGGAVISTDGKVVGISTAIVSPDGNSVGLGFAVPAAMARQVVADLVKTGTVERGYLGVRIQPVEPDMASALGLPAARGALVSEVTPGTPAAGAGLRQGDVVLAVAGKDVADARALSRMVAALPPGEPAELTVWRGGQEVRLEVTVGTMPGDEVAEPARPGAPVPEMQFGLTLSPMTPELRRQLGLAPEAGGVVVTAVDPDSAASEKGLTAGDVILSVGGAPVAAPQDVAAAVEAAKAGGKTSVLLLVARQGAQMFLALPVEPS